MGIDGAFGEKIADYCGGVKLSGKKADVLPPKAWCGATIKLGIGLESYVTDRLVIE